jgi:hypothetical protein
LSVGSGVGVRVRNKVRVRVPSGLGYGLGFRVGAATKRAWRHVSVQALRAAPGSTLPFVPSTVGHQCGATSASVAGLALALAAAAASATSAMHWRCSSPPIARAKGRRHGACR